MYVLVAYDIVDDRRRTRLADRLSEILHRIQKSVFEGYLEPAQVQEVYDRIQDEANLSEDSVLILRLCRGCRASAEYLGVCRELAVEPGHDEVI